MKKEDFHRLLDKQILVCDGAMGSQIYELFGPTPCFEEVNLRQQIGRAHV